MPDNFNEKCEIRMTKSERNTNRKRWRTPGDSGAPGPRSVHKTRVAGDITGRRVNTSRRVPAKAKGRSLPLFGIHNTENKEARWERLFGTGQAFKRKVPLEPLSAARRPLSS